jgi:alpha-pyrone synthase
MENLLVKHQLSLADLDYFAIHPGGSAILRACEQALNLTKSDNAHAYHVLKNYGNMSSATILFVLKSLWGELSARDHHKNIFSCAFGPGLTFESMLLRTHCEN